jgi:hypothetical protein
MRRAIGPLGWIRVYHLPAIQKNSTRRPSYQKHNNIITHKSKLITASHSVPNEINNLTAPLASQTYYLFQNNIYQRLKKNQGEDITSYVLNTCVSLLAERSHCESGLHSARQALSLCMRLTRRKNQDQISNTKIY